MHSSLNASLLRLTETAGHALARDAVEERSSRARHHILLSVRGPRVVIRIARRREHGAVNCTENIRLSIKYRFNDK